MPQEKMTWREGVAHWRQWAIEGKDITARDARRISVFYAELACNCRDYDDYMPAKLTSIIRSNRNDHD